MSSSFFTNMIEKGEFRVDDDGHIQLLKEYMFLVPSPVMAHLYHRLEEELGEDDAAAFMREIGTYQVQQAAERYADSYNFEAMSKERIFEFTQKVIKLIGFGDVEFQDLDREAQTATVSLGKSVFASRYQNECGTVDQPVDHWMAGILEGHFRVIFGLDISVEEIQCTAMGDDQCVFRIRPID